MTFGTNLFSMSLLDYIEAYRNRKEYEANFKASRLSSAVMELMSSTYDTKMERTKHPFHYRRVEEFTKQIKYWKKDKPVTINFGDSLTDLSRTQMARVHNGIFSISGSWAHHMEQMATDLSDVLNSNVKVMNVSVGCLGGNPLLGYQNFDEVVSDSLKCLNTIRQLYPKARIVVYGLPPAFNIHVLRNTWDFDLRLLEWVSLDKNARFISLKELFGRGWGKLFPTTRYSSDGVHFNPEGAARFSANLESNFQPEYL
jgi:hypothetical protein